MPDAGFPPLGRFRLAPGDRGCFGLPVGPAGLANTALVDLLRDPRRGDPPVPVIAIRPAIHADVEHTTDQLRIPANGRQYFGAVDARTAAHTMRDHGSSDHPA